MAKGPAREYVWLQCSECNELNYRIDQKVTGAPKLSLKKYCPHERKHTTHKVKKK